MTFIFLITCSLILGYAIGYFHTSLKYEERIARAVKDTKFWRDICERQKGQKPPPPPPSFEVKWNEHKNNLGL